jgi:hypothetical protein
VPKLRNAFTEVIYQGPKTIYCFLFKCFSKSVETVGYLIATMGKASPLIKYDHKRLNLKFVEGILAHSVVFYLQGLKVFFC